MRDPSTMEVAAVLKPSDFSGCNARIWEAVLELHGRGGLGERTLIEHMRTQGSLANIGTDDGAFRGEDYLSFLATYAETANIKEFVANVEAASIRKQLNGVASLIVAGSTNGRDIDEILDNAEKQLYTLRRTPVEDGQTMGDIVKLLMPRIDGFRDGTIKPAYVPDILAVRNLVEYVDQSDFIIVGGRPGEGKSSFMRWEALKYAQHNKKWVITYNLENDSLEYAKFAISAITGIDSNKLKNPKLLTPRELETVKGAAGELVNLPWKIITLSRPTVNEIDRSARKLATQMIVGKFQVDYIQLIWNDGVENRVNDLSKTTTTLRSIPTRLHVPLVAGSQLSRGIESRTENNNPMLSDLRDSGSLEQDATQVWFLRSMWNNPPTQSQLDSTRYPENAGSTIIKAIPMKVWVLKNRNGPIGISEPIKWIKSTNTYATLTR